MNTILIANRGEIACRVIRSARALGARTVAVYSEADRNSLHVELADEAVHIGPAKAAESYLNVEAILGAARATGATAVHPGYGFLAENAAFATRVAEAGMIWIGPTPAQIEAMGDKERARRIAADAGVAVVPGSDRFPEGRLEGLVAAAAAVGYPLLVKASAGGGGIGMRLVEAEYQLLKTAEATQTMAARSFGDGTIFLERYIPRARHVEIQVFGFGDGRAIHLYERDCSSQRRHQKLIEEAPAPGVDPAKRDRVCESAAALIRNAKYCGAATVEFLMDKDQNFYMLEVNTRVQVEHPISEAITGVDIVQTGIRVAAGEKLPYTQKDIRINGHAIEFRINAEDPDRNFMPQAGLVETWAPPGGPGIRMDSHVRGGYRVPPNYDSMVGKLIVHAPDRATCIQRSLGALREFKVGPIKTTIPLHMRLLREPQFVNATHDIKYVERLLAVK